MSSVFETMDRDAWVEAGAGQSAQKGEYVGILNEFAASGQRYARILTAPESGGRFAGKQASSVTTALKNARDSKNAPDEVSKIKVSSKEGVIYLENEAVEV